jgi:hypothetical protein
MFGQDNTVVRTNVRQRVWLQGESATAFNAIAAHRQMVDAEGKHERMLLLLLRTSQAQYVQSPPKWAMCAYLWYATGGKAGFATMHMLPDDVLLDYLDSDSCRASDAKLILDVMAQHPDQGRARTWEVHGQKYIKIINAAVKAGVKADMAKK